MNLKTEFGTYIHNRDQKIHHIEDLSPKEIAIEFDTSVKTNNKASIDYILLWLEFNSQRETKKMISNDYPEYFL